MVPTQQFNDAKARLEVEIQEKLRNFEKEYGCLFVLSIINHPVSANKHITGLTFSLTLVFGGG